MKITFICVKREEGPGAVWRYTFGVKKSSEDFAVQRIAGDMTIISSEPLHYKCGVEYDVLISSLISLGGGGLNKAKLN